MLSWPPSGLGQLLALLVTFSARALTFPPAAALVLAKLYTNGATGIAADAKPAARWTAFAESTNSENFKPRDPLRK